MSPVFSATLLILRVLLGALFMVSGFTKLAGPPENFLSVVRAYEILGQTASAAAAAILPWLEFIGGVFVFLGLWLRRSLVFLWVLNTVFIGVLISAFLRKLPLRDCGCFGEYLSIPPDKMLFLDLALWACFLVLVIFSTRAGVLSLDRFFGGKSVR